MKRWEKELEKCKADPDYFLKNYFSIVHAEYYDPIELRASDFALRVMNHMDPEEPLFERFIEYWTAMTLKGKKLRFEKEKTFDIPARIRTFRSNEKKFSIVNMLNAGRKK